MCPSPVLTDKACRETLVSLPQILLILPTGTARTDLVLWRPVGVMHRENVSVFLKMIAQASLSDIIVKAPVKAVSPARRTNGPLIPVVTVVLPQKKSSLTEGVNAPGDKGVREITVFPAQTLSLLFYHLIIILLLILNNRLSPAPADTIA